MKIKVLVVMTMKIRGSHGGDHEDKILMVMTMKIRGSHGGDHEDKSSRDDDNED
jgi:hypothetical protein